MSDSYKNLKVWRLGIELTVLCYKITEKFPKSEIYSLTSQIRRCSSSIPANISEGYGRNSAKELIHFLHIALGSLNELETHLIIAAELGYLSDQECEKVEIMRKELAKMLVGLIKSVKKNL